MKFNSADLTYLKAKLAISPGIARIEAIPGSNRKIYWRFPTVFTNRFFSYFASDAIPFGFLTQARHILSIEQLRFRRHLQSAIASTAITATHTRVSTTQAHYTPSRQILKHMHPSTDIHHTFTSNDKHPSKDSCTEHPNKG